MKPKKNSAYSYIAATHWLTSVIGANIFLFVFSFVMAVVFADERFDVVAYIIAAPVMMFLSTRYSVSYLSKTYVITDAAKVINFALIYFVVLMLLLRIPSIIQTGSVPIENLGALFALITFYFTSKKYLKNEMATGA